MIVDKITDKYRPVKGWAEVLYRTKDLTVEEKYPGISGPHNNLSNKVPALSDFNRQDYAPVGSWLPTEEFVHTFDIMKFFQGDVSDLYNIPRPIEAYDAINLCLIEPLAIMTLMVIPKKHVNWYRSMNPQFQTDNDLVVITHSETFKSFRYPNWKMYE